ncbi:hypothetical protein L2Y96_19085 [Luteibacter aegosomaticola]|uniref:hypothetical protein n=1 Tax=Luteibacter aegosomaticola TaxID=2911538 RepID=UPI001FF7BBB0|nr:hypothetical protein [Luteibacter aegosomaticola]UPG89477.1 hypothetical protein L2Y96_19085 [Luteibacter aegosomaticola]
MMAMKFLLDAFDEFGPKSAFDEALRFCLIELLDAHRTEDLHRLVTADGDSFGVAGDPDWFIDRIDKANSDKREGWPAEAEFHASVNPGEFWMSHPDFFASRDVFLTYVEAIAVPYIERRPEDKEVMREVLDALRTRR